MSSVEPTPLLTVTHTVNLKSHPCSSYLRGETHLSKAWRRIVWCKGMMCGGRTHRVVAADDGEEGGAAEMPADRANRKLKEQRLRNLTMFVVVMGIVEGCSCIMTAALYLLLPLQPRVIGGEPVPWHYVAKIWAIQVR